MTNQVLSQDGSMDNPDNHPQQETEETPQNDVIIPDGGQASSAHTASIRN